MPKRLALLLTLLVTAACTAPAAHHAPSPSPSATRGLPARPAVRYDVDGDGIGDLVVTDGDATVDGVYAAGYAAVVHGSLDGPRLQDHQVVTQNSLGLGRAGQGGSFGGRTVSADLDGDGRADLITQAGSDTVFVVLGGPTRLGGAFRLTGSAPLTGDFDGDGHQDLLTVDKRPFTATVRLGPFSHSGVPRARKTLHLGAPGEEFDSATPVAVGDVTGDGRDDVVVTYAHVYADEVPVPRATVVYTGTPQGLPVAGPRLRDAAGHDVYGEDVTTADVDGDGYADVVLGLTCESIGEEAVPAGGSLVTVVPGGPTGRSTRRQPTTVNATGPGLRAALDSSWCGFGAAVTAGDMDGDGYADLAFVAPARGGGQSVVVLRGSARGLTTADARVLPPFPQDPRLALLDVDGDHRADLALGLPFVQGGDGAYGQVRVLRGGHDGIDTTHPLVIRPADLGLTPVDGDRFGNGFGG